MENRDLPICPHKGSLLPPKNHKMSRFRDGKVAFRKVVPGLTLSSICVTVSVSMSVSMSSFHMSNKFLHHEKGDNSTEDPQSHRQNGALS